MWDVKWTKWHWGQDFLLELRLSPLSIIPPVLHNHSSASLWMGTGPIKGRNITKHNTSPLRNKEKNATSHSSKLSRVDLYFRILLHPFFNPLFHLSIFAISLSQTGVILLQYVIASPCIAHKFAIQLHNSSDRNAQHGHSKCNSLFT